MHEVLWGCGQSPIKSLCTQATYRPYLATWRTIDPHPAVIALQYLNGVHTMVESIARIFQPLANKQFDLLLIIYLVAITAEAMSGALAAGGRRNLPAFRRYFRKA